MNWSKSHSTMEHLRRLLSRVNHTIGCLTRCFVVSALVVTAGCAHYAARGLDDLQGAGASVQQREADGLYIAVEDLTNPRESVKYFDRSLVDHGFAPVIVLLEMDVNSKARFDVNKDDMRLVLNTGERLEPVEPDAVAETVAYSYWRSTFGFLFLVPGFFVVSSVSDANAELLDDYQSKAFKNVRIHPNFRSLSGVVFFKLPPESAPLDMRDSFVEVKVYKHGEDGALGDVFDLAVHFHDS